MISSLSPDYQKSEVFKQALSTVGRELEDYSGYAASSAAQRYIQTATYTLSQWEQEYGLSVSPALPLEERRSQVIAKLRGTGTVTLSLLQSIAESYEGGNVNITEYPQEGRIELSFTKRKGEPPYISQLRAVLGEIIPAHLAIDYLYRYSRWSELKVYRYSDLRSKTWQAATVV